MMNKDNITNVTISLDTDELRTAKKIMKSKGYTFEEAVRLLVLYCNQMNEFPFLVPSSLRDKIKGESSSQTSGNQKTS